MDNYTEIYEVVGLFFDSKPISFKIIDSSRNENDFRETVIVTFVCDYSRK